MAPGDIGYLLSRSPLHQLFLVCVRPGIDNPGLGNHHPELHPGDPPDPDQTVRGGGWVKGKSSGGRPHKLLGHEEPEACLVLTKVWLAAASCPRVPVVWEPCCSLSPGPSLGGSKLGRSRPLWWFLLLKTVADVANVSHSSCAAGPVRLGGSLPGRLGPCSNSPAPSVGEPLSAPCSLILIQVMACMLQPVSWKLPSASPEPPLLSFRAFGLSLASRIGRTRGSSFVNTASPAGAFSRMFPARPLSQGL